MDRRPNNSFRPRLNLLEDRTVPSAVPLTSGEQYFLELVNRARQNPVAEAARLGINLNEGLAAGTISSAPKQPLAANQDLLDAIRGHLIDLQTHSIVSHYGSDGSNPFSRTAAQGYRGSELGEILAYRAASASETADIDMMHRLLFVDPGVAGRGHRTELLEPAYKEVGSAVHSGPFASPYGTYTIRLVGQDMGARSGASFLTGVVYSDTVSADRFYTPGEGRGGVTIKAVNTSGSSFQDVTGPAGGYQLQLPPGTYNVTFSDNIHAPRVVTGVGVGSQNVKLDTVIDPNSPLLVNSTKFSGRQFAIGADAGGAPLVNVFDAATGALRFSFDAYDSRFRGGVRVATGDVTGDRVADIITAPGPGGGPHVKVFNGMTGQLIQQFFAYTASFASGVYVAAGDVDGDGRAEIITGTGAGGGPHVRIFSSNGAVRNEYYAYAGSFLGGVRVAAGDVNGDGKADVITGTGPGGGPHVRVFNSGRADRVLREFYAYSPSFSGGIYVAAGDVNGDGRADIITGPGAGGGPHVRVFDLNPLAEIRSFYAVSRNYLGGVRVSTVNNNEGHAQIILGLGAGADRRIRVLDSLTLADEFNLDNQLGQFADRVYVG